MSPKIELLTVAEVAAILNCSESLVYQLVEAGKIAVHRIGNGRGTIRFRPDDVEEYLEACRVEKPARVRKKRKKVTTESEWF